MASLRPLARARLEEWLGSWCPFRSCWIGGVKEPVKRSIFVFRHKPVLGIGSCGGYFFPHPVFGMVPFLIVFRQRYTVVIDNLAVYMRHYGRCPFAPCLGLHSANTVCTDGGMRLWWCVEGKFSGECVDLE